MSNILVADKLVTHHSGKPVAEPRKLFDEARVLRELRHYLPTQTPLKDFIHHNSLHAFQHLKFHEAIFRASKIFGYQVTLQLADYRKLYQTSRIRQEVLERILGERKGEAAEEWKQMLLNKEYEELNEARIGQLRAEWKNQYKLDLDNLVQPLLFRIVCSYLDQGIALWKFPVSEKGFLESIRNLEASSFSSFFRTKHARQLFLSGDWDIRRLLQLIVGDEAYYEQYLFDQQFSHRGWSGMAATVETSPHSLLDGRVISLHDLIVFELFLELDALDFKLGRNRVPLSEKVKEPALDIFSETQLTELDEVLILWQHAFEWSYYDEVLSGISLTKSKPRRIRTRKSFQAMFCIDERECSLRRHLEKVDINCETFGTPGFFSVEFFFQAENGKFYDKLCPAPVTPKYLIKEKSGKPRRKHELLYSPGTNTWLRGMLMTICLGTLAGVRMLANLFSPKMSPAISNAFAHMNANASLTIENKSPDDVENGLQVGFTIEEMANRVESLLRSIGLTRNFAGVIYCIAHGSSSANNPHHGAHDCGACSGRPGSVNARVFAFMANHPKVRKKLEERKIIIPEDTVFIGGLHDTASDQVEFFDETMPGDPHHMSHKRYKVIFEKALDLNAKERSRRFASINTRNDLDTVRDAILDRSVSMFEPRPELGHGTNTLCIVGGRHLTKGLFLDRRAFLNSYDHTSDPSGALLTGVMRPLGPVCGGINLEYYFSRVDNHKLGAGTKLPHNVMGLIGVANSSDGDLRPGLPLQMIEVHDPVRLLIIVEHFPEVVLSVIQSSPEMYEWYQNEWVHIIVVHPDTSEFYYFRNGIFERYQPGKIAIKEIDDFKEFVESAKEMETNYIVDATKENLPVYTIN